MYCLCIYLAKHWPIYLTLQDWATGNPVCFQNIFNVKLSSNFLNPIKSAHGETDVLLTAKGYGAPFKAILAAKPSTWRLEEGSRQHSCHWPLVSRALTLINTLYLFPEKEVEDTLMCAHICDWKGSGERDMSHLCSSFTFYHMFKEELCFLCMHFTLR